uniref:SCP domain-containing protein n=1 Tax=Angiostrongylus cantonensis TaxID=6313 RepID=A0A0K0D2B2_ANGCA
MYKTLALVISVICVQSIAAKLPFVKDETCSLKTKFKQMFEEFHRQHNFSVVWDCGLENLAKTEFDRAQAATQRFPLTGNEEYYLILTSKGKNLRQALKKAEYMEPDTKYGCNTEKRGAEQIFACLYFTAYVTIFAQCFFSRLI